jgi:plastocyanin
MSGRRIFRAESSAVTPIMTLRLLICFNVLVLGAIAGTVSGKVSLEGSKEKRVTQKRDFSSVVIWLDPVGNHRVPLTPQKRTIEQKDKMFLPHVLAVPIGSSVDFPNYDPIFHNAFSNFEGQMFDVGLYPPKTTRTVKFHREGIVRVFCNIHPSMSAVIAVLRTPYFDVTAADGSYRISGVAPGEYILKVFHERATEATLESVSRRITVSDDDLTIPAFAVSEAGYIALPHKNKYGRDYPPGGKDTVPYPGGPR